MSKVIDSSEELEENFNKCGLREVIVEEGIDSEDSSEDG